MDDDSSSTEIDRQNPASCQTPLALIEEASKIRKRDNCCPQDHDKRDPNSYAAAR
jgi:hypothetical protein